MMSQSPFVLIAINFFPFYCPIRKELCVKINNVVQSRWVGCVKRFNDCFRHFRHKRAMIQNSKMQNKYSRVKIVGDRSTPFLARIAHEKKNTMDELAAIESCDFDLWLIVHLNLTPH